ncbi:hypothetical protein CRUP_027738 [Coryphaenoides rupestris]|nr:hypothetical protein CRUP_027738 [Coryphaenoides rupestris]
MIQTYLMRDELTAAGIRRRFGVFDAVLSASQPGRQAGRQEGRKAGRKAGREAGRQCDTNGLFFSRAPPGGRRLSRKVGLSANTSQFTLAGEPFRILGGSMHYFRVPRAYWRDRLMKTKACGINTVTT